MNARTLILAALLVLSAGVAPVAAQDGTATDTPTATPTPNSTPTPTATETPTPTPTATPTPASGEGNASDQGGPLQDDEQAADLFVAQPRYINQPVETTTDGGTVIYAVRGNVQELEPQNFNVSDVVRSGVREDSATLKLDSSIGRYILDAQGTAGTYRVFWVVRNDAGETTTYVAVINVQQAAYQHVSPNRWEELQSAADNWEWTIGQFADAGIVGDEASLEKQKAVISDAVTWYEFYLNPAQALSGQFTTILIMLVSWPAGWIIIGSLLLLFFIRDRRKTKQNRRYKRQFARIEDVDEAERRAEERELKRMLSMKSFTDLGLSESDGEAIREHTGAQNPRQFLEQLRGWLSERRIVRMLLGAHTQLGHVLEVERDAAGDVVDVRLLTDEARADGGAAAVGDDSDHTIERITPASADDDVVLAMDWDDLDPDVLWDESVSAGDLDLPVANQADAEDDLVADWNIPIGEDGHEYYILERREEFADLLLEFIKQVAASQYTDADGHIRPEVELVEFMYTFVSEGAEKYRWSLHDTVDVLLYNRQRLDADDRMTDIADRSREGEL